MVSVSPQSPFFKKTPLFGTMLRPSPRVMIPPSPPCLSQQLLLWLTQNFPDSQVETGTLVVCLVSSRNGLISPEALRFTPGKEHYEDGLLRAVIRSLHEIQALHLKITPDELRSIVEKGLPLRELEARELQQLSNPTAKLTIHSLSVNHPKRMSFETIRHIQEKIQEGLPCLWLHVTHAYDDKQLGKQRQLPSTAQIIALKKLFGTLETLIPKNEHVYLNMATHLNSHETLIMFCAPEKTLTLVQNQLVLDHKALKALQIVGHENPPFVHIDRVIRRPSPLYP
jgi:hypothetical protein